MPRFTFAQEQDIRRIAATVLAQERQIQNRRLGAAARKTPQIVETYAARVNDVGGIAALTGTTPGSGTVDVYDISDGTLTAVADMAGITAYNSSASALRETG